MLGHRPGLSSVSSGRCIFVVTHLFPYPAVRGVELRINKLLRWLHNQGYKVVLVLSGELEEQYRAKELSPWVHSIYGVRPALRTRLGRRLPRLRRLVWENVKPVLPHRGRPADTHESFIELVPSTAGDEGRKRELSSDRLAPLVAKLARKYKPLAVIAEYIFLTDCFALLTPGTLRIIDTLDVFSLKERQVVRYGINDPWTCSREEERTYLLRSDVVLAIQDEEARVLKEVVPEREVLTVGIDFDVRDAGCGVDVPSNSVTVVGSDNPLNVHGLRSFLDECWPAIKSAHPAVVLNVVGRVGSRCKVSDPSVNYFAGVDDLSDLYRQSRVVINPAVAGTGLKVKSVEALAHGRPLVAWSRGVEGLGYSGEAPYIKCDSWTEFAGAVIRVLRSEQEARDLSDRARAFARLKFNPETVYAALDNCLKSHEHGRTFERA
jgi:glycosyltransferase involved in cell wall biosynthesis